MSEKKDIKELIQQEETHLNNLLEPNDLKSFKEIEAEIIYNWTKEHILINEIEDRILVLQDNRYPLNTSGWDEPAVNVFALFKYTWW